MSGPPPATVRLFCALRLPGAAAEAVSAWQVRELHGVRVVPAENLHLTLVFLGATPRSALGAVGEALRAEAAAAREIRLQLAAYRETRSVAMLSFDDEGGHAGALARGLTLRLEQVGLCRPERRRWLPHLTVARFASPPHLRPALPALGVLSPSDAAVYSSALRREGARYEVVEAMRLGG